MTHPCEIVAMVVLPAGRSSKQDFLGVCPRTNESQKAANPEASAAFGNAGIGNIRYAMTMIWFATSITFITAQRNEDTSVARPIGRMRVLINILGAVSFFRIVRVRGIRSVIVGVSVVDVGVRSLPQPTGLPPPCNLRIFAARKLFRSRRVGCIHAPSQLKVHKCILQLGRRIN